MIFSKVAVPVLEDLYGKNVFSILEDITGVSSKTWKKGGPSSPVVVERARVDASEKGLKKLLEQGFSRSEAAEYVAIMRSGDTGLWFALTRIGLPPNDPRICPVTTFLAQELDELDVQLAERHKAGDLIGFQQILLDSRLLEEGAEWIVEVGDISIRKLREAPGATWEQAQRLMTCVLGVGIFRLLACWDVEFFSRYFYDLEAGIGLIPKPVFGWLLPKLRPSAMPNTNGTYPVRGLFRLPIRHLLELSYCIATNYRIKSWPSPDRIRRTDIASSGGVVLLGKKTTEQPLAKIYKGIRGLTADEYLQVWSSMCGTDENENGPLPPWPLYIAALVWTRLFVQKSTEKKISGAGTLTSMDPEAYNYWWNHWKTELAARGTEFGRIPWPDYSAMP